MSTDYAPTQAPLKVMMCASEVNPFAKTGGLADVVGALPKYLAKLGHDVRVTMPLYGSISREGLTRLEAPLGVPVGWGEIWGAVWQGTLPGSEVPIYFLENEALFNRPGIYGSKSESYPDNLARFAFLSRGTLQLCKYLGFHPDVFHVHDWMTAMIPMYLNTWEKGSPLGQAASVLTIHNLAHQGWFLKEELPTLQLDWSHFTYLELEAYDKINILKGGIYHSTLLTTVSPTYALEIQTPQHGYALDGVIRTRGDSLFGILNGIDEHIWDPAVDTRIPANYDAEHMEGKAVCKAELQREAGLPIRPDLPLYGMVSRFDKQKGYDVLAAAIPRLLKDLDIQLVMLGTGEYWAETFFGNLSHDHPNRVQAWIGFDPALAHRIEAGCDFFIMPSHFEPCGLNQMYSQRYGSLPVVHATGGLDDTVENYNEETGGGTGFKIYDLTPSSLFDTIGWSCWAFHNRPEHIQAMRKRAMKKHFTWGPSAKEYVKVYRNAVRRRRYGFSLAH